VTDSAQANKVRARADAAMPGAEPDQEQGWIVPLMVLVVGSFMSILDTTIVNVAIPKMTVQLSAPADDVAWVVTGYTLVMGVMVPLSGWLGERLGQTRLYLYSIIGFAATSALCGLAWNLPSMIVCRVLQAVPGAILPVIAMTLLLRIVPPSKLGAAMGIYGLGSVVAPAIGPVLGGYFVEYIDWRLIFFVNVPVGLAGAAATIAVFPRHKSTSWPPFDWWGFIAIGYGLFAFLFAFEEGSSWGWTSYPIMILFVSGALSLAAWVVIELEVNNPLVDLRVFQYWPYVNSLLLTALVISGMFSALFFIPQFLQNVQGMQALASGLVLLPAALVTLVMMPIAGRIYDVIGARWPSVIGLLLLAYGTYLMADLTPDTPRSNVEFAMMIRNFGVALSMMPIMTSGLAALPRALNSAGSTTNNIVRQFVSSVAIAIFASVNTSAEAQILADRGALLDTGAAALPQVKQLTENGSAGLRGLYQQLRLQVITQTYNNGFFISVILCLIAAALALLLRSGKPGRTNTPALTEL
jgi:EmrB/QacA subfamily drug resistance transporter